MFRTTRILTCSLWTGIGLVVLSGMGCQPPQRMAGAQKPVLIINELEMSGEELREDFALAARGPDHRSNEAPPGKEPEWLGRVIERELLVQEAQRLGLDRNPAFMSTIERFWKEALLKQLVQLKGQEIASQAHVYEPEVEQRYAKLSREDPSLGSLSEMREEIQRMIREEKQQEAMERWIQELRAKAKIRVDGGALAQLQ